MYTDKHLLNYKINMFLIFIWSYFLRSICATLSISCSILFKFISHFFCELLPYTFEEMPVLVYGYVLKIRLRGSPGELNVNLRGKKVIDESKAVGWAIRKMDLSSSEIRKSMWQHVWKREKTESRYGLQKISISGNIRLAFEYIILKFKEEVLPWGINK